MKHIRKATLSDLPAMLAIYAEARAYMIANGNPNQWGKIHSTQAAIENDILSGKSYVCVNNGDIIAAFYFAVEEDPTYSTIDGTWLNDEPYGVIHRLARGKSGTGVGEFILKWCLAQHPNIRIDTHENNTPMKNLLSKLGFVYCGIIWVRISEERLAFGCAYQKDEAEVI